MGRPLTSHMGSFVKLVSIPALGPSRPALRWGFPLRKQLWTMGVAPGIPIASGPRDPGRLYGPFTGPHPQHPDSHKLKLPGLSSRGFQVLLFSHSE